MRTWFGTSQIQSPSHCNKPFVRMCSSGNHFPDFADIGDTVVLFVDFGEDCKPVKRSNLEHTNGASAEWQSPIQHHLVDEDEQQYEVNIKMNEKHLKADGYYCFYFFYIGSSP